MNSHDNLLNHYTVNSALHDQFKYSFDEIYNMLPFEREVYIALIMDRERKKNQNQAASSQDMIRTESNYE